MCGHYGGATHATKTVTDNRLTRRQFAAAVGAVALGGTVQAAQAQTKPFRIGMLAPLSGTAAPFGVEYAEGARIYVKAWNERGGYKGKPVELDMVDDESGSVGAVNAFKKH